jgi:hypothetical protein
MLSGLPRKRTSDLRINEYTPQIDFRAMLSPSDARIGQWTGYGGVMPFAAAPRRELICSSMRRVCHTRRFNALDQFGRSKLVSKCLLMDTRGDRSPRLTLKAGCRAGDNGA